ncbi:autotransporter outer membrane beta-barrel domain-containing protein [Prochlorococcus sp. MIT 1303]|uniref:autotransporter outer membrane beta-barrel domain-containing protein n=1 Tax=Prochlorococcus sp. MIT 1303 TaxID=1723647 RepID=UPI0012E7A56C|nr:autotransporter outer membrane beta-barrel domain-containing protein [Prochlorococcus sp. MIT 1303]
MASAAFADPVEENNFSDAQSPYSYQGNVTYPFIYSFGGNGEGGEGASCTESATHGETGGDGQDIDFQLQELDSFPGLAGAQSSGGEGGSGGGGGCFHSGVSGADGGNPGNVDVRLSAGVFINNQGDADLGYAVDLNGYFIGAIASGAAGNGGKGGNTTWSGTGSGNGGNGGVLKGEDPSSVSLTADNGSVIKVLAKNPVLGLFAQSTGGLGGDAGEKSWIAGGSNGGDGGFSGPVNVENHGVIQASILSDDALGGAGILMQSVGGQGGQASGGTSLITYGGTEGGTGGVSGNVSVINTGTIITSGNSVVGINAQSIGGGGGAVPGSTSLYQAAGNSGGAGGDGGNALVEMTSGKVKTFGDYSTGILAQSIGGAGGNVGYQTSLNTVGSQAGGGGDGKEANVQLTGGAIITGSKTKPIGSYSPGVLIQSIGGGGGSAGTNTGILAIGSYGGEGGDGGLAKAILANASITTYEQYSPGMQIQSIGGGGGNGGNANSGSVSSLHVGGADGGEGGAGGNAGDVYLNSSESSSEAAISTRANHSPGILLQSIGGGGGSGGSAFSISASTTSSSSVAVGGKGGSGGDGGQIYIGNDYRFGSLASTSRSFSPAFAAMSIGGGGGKGGDSTSMSAGGTLASAISVGGQGGNGGDSGLINSKMFGTYATDGFQSPALSFQSIGGGGGTGGSSMSLSAGGIAAASVSVGGAGGEGGEGGSVQIQFDGQALSDGLFSPGININSIGGGGGTGGSSMSLGVAGIGAASVSVGGKAGSGGDAGDLGDDSQAIDIQGLFSTNDLFSPAIYLSSIGGGGGTGGSSIAASGSAFASFSVSVGGLGAGAGSGGDVNASINTISATDASHSPVVHIQSIGGGGGTGGSATSGSISINPIAALSSVVGVGAKGGDGGDGGDLSLSLAGNYVGGLSFQDLVSTPISFSPGVLAQSIGGGGGNGGASTGLGASFAGIGALNGNVSLGGSAGSGGNGGVVDIHLGDVKLISTKGSFSPGVFAQSIGGGGGTGGTSYSISSAAADSVAANASVALGGSGGGGGFGSSVSLESNGESINTQGSFSPGLSAQSIGGGGGLGGSAFTLSIPVSGDLSMDGSYSSGGLGGSGNTSSDVVLTSSSNIFTNGTHSPGLSAQSIGGGGGSGGSNLLASASLSGSLSADGSGSLGGKGGSGGDSGSVTIESTADLLSSRGSFSPTIYAQSIGGGGGFGGSSLDISGSVGARGISSGTSIGGAAGAGGSAGGITIVNSSDLMTGDLAASDASGLLSPGILAQSIGGGGGYGGSAIAGSFTLSSNSFVNNDNSIGGSAAAGGNGGDIFIDNQSDISKELSIVTLGDQASAIAAMSIGGGGGKGGVSKSGSFSISGSSTLSMLNSIGGSGGAAGDGGSISIENNGVINTGLAFADFASGHFSHGVLAQSIGGGGGEGGTSYSASLSGTGRTSLNAFSSIGGSGANAGDGGNVEINNVSSQVNTKGNFASGISAQSIGGGGGAGGNAISLLGSIGARSISAGVDVGGQAGSGGDGGELVVKNNGSISTGSKSGERIFGHFSPGIIAQSVGGGGGFGGNSVNTQLSGTVGEKANASLGVSVGGSGARGGDGGDILFSTNHFAISTLGNFSPSIVVQSIGGGGGSGGSSSTFNRSINLSSSAVIDGGVSLGGEGGLGGSGGDLDLSFFSKQLDVGILTAGDFAYGLMAQSIGGGGGTGGTSSSYSETSSFSGRPITLGFQKAGLGGGGGMGGDISIDGSGQITTFGYSSSALVAQSIGGGGGAGGQVDSFASTKTQTGTKLQGSTSISIGGVGGSGNKAGSVTVLPASGSGGKLQLATRGHHSFGLLAQSIGGGGGVGGSSSESLESESKAKYALGSLSSFGGAAGDGADAGEIQIGQMLNPLPITISTQGIGSPGLVAQSIGGGGGVAGSASSEAQGGSMGSVMSFGASGGAGGSGKLIQVSARGDITTSGFLSPSLLAQSIGGGGGLAGSSTSIANLQTGSSSSSSLELGIAGSSAGAGGSGGNGGDIQLDFSGNIVTQNIGSDGLLIQSIGGGGGYGGVSTSESTAAAAKKLSASLAMSLGGSGGDGGNGGTITSDTSLGLDVLTRGDSSIGLALQSLGGGGGRGGAVTSSTTTDSSAELTLGASASRGGSGGGGGQAGSVSLGSNKKAAQIKLLTTGRNAPTMVLQSIGGGGGIGSQTTSGATSGNLSATFALGGSGGDGGSGGKVLLNSEIQATSLGDASHGLLLQSIGGGGGQGGVVTSNVSAKSLSAESDISLGMSVAVGGKGGTGANADSVTADLSGSVNTYGNHSSGLTLQSIGGGGGSAGRVISSSQASESELSLGLSVALGAQGGEGADAGQIVLTTSSIEPLKVRTEGAISPAILLQSIGGGGGQSSIVNSVASATDSDYSLGAGFSKTGSSGGGGDGASVVVDLKQLDLQTSGPVSAGLIAQSIGGGGGSAGAVSSSLGKAEIGFAASLGGQGGSGGDGGRIKINTGPGKIMTSGAASNAVLVQSIGGGGGQASQVKTGRSLANTTITGALGGAGAGGGQGELVSIENQTSLLTTGNNSVGLLAQSIGGGGGSSNMSLAKDRSFGSFQGHIQVGGTAGAGGDGGPVTLDNYSTVTTSGEQSHSIFVQSIGGGGGRVAFQAGRPETESQMSLNFGGTAGSGGDGKAIDIYNSGRIIATGNSSYGIYSQSLGGGGGSLSSTSPVSISLGARGGDGGDGGAIAITNSKDASITTAGENGVGILALSLGGGGGDVAVTQDDVTLGSSGGTGGSGGNILVVNKGGITTRADGGVGIYAKSIGGGGGRVTDSINSGDLRLGSMGVAGSDGGEVEVLNLGSITSIGPNSVPIQLSNLGGGGGDARDGYGQGQLGSIRSSGTSGASTLTNSGAVGSWGSSSPAVFQQSIGGGGGSVNSLNGDARLGSISANSAQNTRPLELNNTGNIFTHGDFSPGILVQAIGGGGGRVNIVSGDAFLGSQLISETANLSSGSIDIESIGNKILTLGDISPGIVAQSIGGGGGWVGVIGENLNMGVEKASGLLRSGLVKVDNQSDILTAGKNSAGMILQSVGGGGGLSSYAGGSIYLGSQDGEGVLSSGGMVVDNDAEIRTIDDSSAGIAALTIGGGGGFISGSNNKVADLIRLGGSGNQIGISKISEVRVSKNSVISTEGLNSPGILAQSVGGGGGYTNQAAKVASLGQIGGFGEGGDVSVINHGRISTSGRRSIGVVAQSIGAGGGTADQSTERLWMGARGGARGSAGNVSVKNTKGVITTSGNHSIAVVAQSVGGGGGRLSTASGDVQLGASGGSGDGGEVTLANIDGIISTTGAFSPPYLMQSVGGGGGHVASAGDAIAIDTSVMLGGGIDGTEGNGGQLKLLNYSGVIESQGKFSPGVIHQSIGGGGGWLGDMPAGILSMGGLTTGPSSGSDLNLRLPLSVQTGAANSPGVLVQSLGAGGGVAGRVFNQASLGGTLQESVIGDAGSIVYSSNDLPIITLGDESPGVILQSIGGGGGWIGSVGEDVDMGARMQANSSAEGSNISAISNSIILTRGKHSPAFVAQTIGGGGGYVQLADSVDFGVSDGLAASLSASTESGDITFVNDGSLRTKGLNSFGVLLQSVAGGGGISGSKSGQVSLADGNDSPSGDIEFTNLGTIETTGLGAHAVVLQSISGGGGYVFGATNIDAFPQGESRPSGRSGDITIRNSGDIFAKGQNSIGVFANTATNGAFVYQNPDGTISQQIQNISDGDEYAGQVRVTNSGQIVASGVGGIGITKSTNLKQSHGNLYVENLEGALIQGGPDGAAIQLPTDETETVINKGMIIGGPLGQDPAIRGVRGNDLVENYSLIAGDINIPGGRTQVINHEGARIEANQIVLDRRSSFINEGLLSPNGAHRLGEVTIAAKYIQSESGNYLADLEVPTGDTDHLNLLFASALGGNIVLVPTKTGQAIPGSFMSDDILDSGRLPYDSLDFVYPESAVASYALVPGSKPGSSLAFEYDVDFSPAGLDPNSKAVGDAVNEIQLAGSTSAEQRLFTAYAYSLPTVSELNEAYRQVSGEQNTAFSQSILQVTRNFLDTVQSNISDVNLDSYNSCSVLTYSGDEVGESADQVTPCPRWRAWFETGSYQSSTPGQGSSKQSDIALNSFNSSLGVDALLSENTSVGIAGQFSKIWTNTYNLAASGSANLWNGLAYVKQKLGSKTFLTAQFGAGSSQTDIDRYVTLPISTTESSKVDAWNLMGRLQLSHDIETNKNGGLLKPSIGIGYLVNSQSAYEESTDASSLGWRPDSNRFDNSLDLLEPSHSLKYSSQSYTSIPLELKLDFKHPFEIGNVDLVSRIDVGYGLDLGDTSREITAEFANAPGPTFTVAGTPAPSSWWDLGLALDVHFDERFMIYLNGRTQLAVGGSQSINYGGGFRFRF